MAFGFKPRKNTSACCAIVTNGYSILSTATAIYCGDMVKQLTDGTITVAAAGELIIGRFAGCNYVSAKGVPVSSPNWDAPVGAKDIRALVHDDPGIEFAVIANADVTAANVGALYDFVYAAGNVVNGDSGVMLDIASLGTIDKAFRITGITNTPGDNLRTVYGVFIEHALRGVVAGVGGV